MSKLCPSCEQKGMLLFAAKVNDETTTHVEEEIRAGFEIWDTFTSKVRWDGLGVRPFPI